MTRPKDTEKQDDEYKSMENLRQAIKEQKKEYSDMLDYSCGLKCRVCPFPGAQCTLNGRGNKE